MAAKFLILSFWALLKFRFYCIHMSVGCASSLAIHLLNSLLNLDFSAINLVRWLSLVAAKKYGTDKLPSCVTRFNLKIRYNNRHIHHSLLNIQWKFYSQAMHVPKYLFTYRMSRIRSLCEFESQTSLFISSLVHLQLPGTYKFYTSHFHGK